MVKGINRTEDCILSFLDKKHKNLKRTLEKVKVIKIPPPKEKQVHESIADYLNAVLIPERSEFTSHDASVGLGIYLPKNTDSSLTRACKNFYNGFVRAAQNKFISKGVKKGWPDLLIHWEGGKSLWLEIKRKGKNPEDYQLEVHIRLNKLGVPVEVPRSVEDVRALLVKYNIPNRERLSL